MANATSRDNVAQQGILTQEQDALLDMYIERLDNFLNDVKASERIQVEIETLHLKRILTK